MENTLDKHQFLVLLNCPARQVNQPFAVAQVLASGIATLATEFQMFVCVSNTSHTLKELNNLFLKNDSMLKNIYLTDRVRILNTDEEKIRQPIYTEEEIMNLFRNMHYHTGKISEILMDFFHGFDVYKHTLGSISDACESLLEKVNEYAVQNQVENCDLMERFYKKYLFCEDIEKIKKDFSEYFLVTLCAIHRKEKDQENLFNQINEYIDKNYRRKLTLQILASRFYISPAYCSNLLKENLNMTFNDYISKIRIEKAKQLLSQTSISVAKVSDEIGYSNPKYFFKIFKSYTGLTPLEYRSKNN